MSTKKIVLITVVCTLGILLIGQIGYWNGFNSGWDRSAEHAELLSLRTQLQAMKQEKEIGEIDAEIRKLLREQGHSRGMFHSPNPMPHGTLRDLGDLLGPPNLIRPGDAQ